MELQASGYTEQYRTDITALAELLFGRLEVRSWFRPILVVILQYGSNRSLFPNRSSACHLGSHLYTYKEHALAVDSSATR